MKIKVLASGSKGNSTLIMTENCKLLIDAGISYRKIKKFLSDEEINVSELNGVLVTHVHSDHISGLASLVAKENTKIYIQEDQYEEIAKVIPQDYIEIVKDKNLNIEDIEIEYLNMSHDQPCYSYIISDGDKRIYYVTDTGYINRRYKEKISNMDMYLIESNHNEVMLMEGPYPTILKQRVISDSGHMSNKYAGKILREVIGDKTEYIVLMHISENNNTEEMAITEVDEELSKVSYMGRLIPAKQHEPLELIELC